MTTCTIKLKWKQNSHCFRFIPINVGAAEWSKNGGEEIGERCDVPDAEYPLAGRK